MNRRTLLAAALAAPSLAVGGCGIFTKSYRYNFRIKLYSVINGKERVDSSVIQGRWVDTVGFSPTARWQDSFRGEAILVKLAHNGALVALLGSVQGHTVKSEYFGGFTFPLTLFKQLSGTRNWRSDAMLLEAVPRILDRERDVPHDLWPIVVYFPDLSRIETARYEDVDGFGDDLGKDSKVLRFSISLTDDPITMGIDESLPWLNEVGTFKNDPTQERSLLPVYQQFKRNNFCAEGREL